MRRFLKSDGVQIFVTLSVFFGVAMLYFVGVGQIRSCTATPAESFPVSAEMRTAIALERIADSMEQYLLYMAVPVEVEDEGFVNPAPRK